MNGRAWLRRVVESVSMGAPHPVRRAAEVSLEPVIAARGQIVMLPLSLSLVLVLACAIAAPVRGSTAVRPPSLSPDPHSAGTPEDPPLFWLKDVRPGLRGQGVTVFSSLRGPEPFGFEVLGVMHNYLGPGEDLIIAKLVGEQIERTGVIAGMSGSPAYIDGKLVGAVGYRFGSFTKDAIAGITPIERMLTAKVPPSRGARATAGTTPWGAATPIAMPLMVSGVPQHVITAFAPLFEQRGYPTLMAGSSPSGGTGFTPHRFFAGGPISAHMVDGDINIGGIGTVTWVKGDRFVAFGHPMNGDGNSNIPVGNAHVVTTVASEAGSWKMGEATSTIGVLTDDRLHAIAGTMGQTADVLPLTVELVADSPRKTADAKNNFTLSVMQHDTDTPLYCAMALAGVVANRVAAERGGTIDIETTAVLSTGQRVVHRARAADVGMGYDMPAAFDVLAFLSSLLVQDFVEVHLTSVAVKVAVRSDIARMRIVGAEPLSVLTAGKRASLRVRLAPFRGPEIEQTLEFVVPAGVAEKPVTLVVAGSAEASRVERDLGIVAAPIDYVSYVNSIALQAPPGAVRVYLVDDVPGVRLQGRRINALPASLLGVVSDGAGQWGQAADVEGRRLTETVFDSVVSGELTLRLTVRHAQGARQ